MDDIEKRRADRWNFLFIAGMWFQDLFNYDFRRTEMCIIPYATQQGEISFCAYNTGIGWRNIIEKMHMTATLTKWYEEHGRHEIFAGNKAVPLNSTEHSLKLNAEAVRAGAQTDLDELGIAKNAREEKLRPGAQAQDARGSSRRKPRTTPRWPSSTRSTCSRSSRRSRFRAWAAAARPDRAPRRPSRPRRPKCCTNLSFSDSPFGIRIRSFEGPARNRRPFVFCLSCTTDEPLQSEPISDAVRSDGVRKRGKTGGE